VDITESSSQLLQFSYGVFLANLVTLFCLINITGYILTQYLLEKADFEKKNPTIVKDINRFKFFSFVYICLEITVCLASIFVILFFSFVIISQHQSSV
jgi:hypothetical protein